MAKDNIQDRNEALHCDQTLDLWKKVQASFYEQILTQKTEAKSADLLKFEGALAVFRVVWLSSSKSSGFCASVTWKHKTNLANSNAPFLFP